MLPKLSNLFGKNPETKPENAPPKVDTPPVLPDQPESPLLRPASAAAAKRTIPIPTMKRATQRIPISKNLSAIKIGTGPVEAPTFAMPQMPATGAVELPLGLILSRFPTDMLTEQGQTWLASGTPGTASIPLSALLPLLPTGRIEFPAREIASYLPEGLVVPLDQHPAADGLVSLPLPEVVSLIPVEYLATRQDQKPVDSRVTKMETPFSPEAFAAATPAMEQPTVTETPMAMPEPQGFVQSEEAVSQPMVEQTPVDEPQIQAQPSFEVSTPQEEPAPDFSFAKSPEFQNLMQAEEAQSQPEAQHVEQPTSLEPMASEVVAEVSAPEPLPVVAPEPEPIAEVPVQQAPRATAFQEAVQAMQAAVKPKNSEIPQQKPALPSESLQSSIPQFTPRKSEPISQPQPTGGKFNINDCTLVELMERCPEDLARKILAWKELYGEFPQASQLWQIPGMTTESYHKLAGLSDGDVLVDLGDELGWAQASTMTLKDLMHQIRSWPYVKACSLVSGDGLTIVSDGHNPKETDQLSALAVRLLSEINPALQGTPWGQSHELHVMLDSDQRLSIFQSQSITLVIMGSGHDLSSHENSLLRKIAEKLGDWDAATRR
jgi:predicted regulator of Ras-like GTPase activity (Roadblock/LC7/MglB family)/DNA uptake protein ComE-like DNA-binding protein